MKDYHDMLSSLKDKVIGAAGKATVAVTDAAGKVSETVTDAANKVVSDEMRDKVAGAAHAVGDRAKYASHMARLTVDCNAELEAQMDELRTAAKEYRPAPDLHTVDADVTIEPEDIEVEVTEEPAPEE